MAKKTYALLQKNHKKYIGIFNPSLKHQGDGKTFAANALFPPPKNFTAEATKKDLPRERMIRSVTRGRPGTAMMPWESILSKQEIHSVVNYIRQILMGLQK